MSTPATTPSIASRDWARWRLSKHGKPRGKAKVTKFFRDSSLEFQTRGVLGRAVHGASDVGEILETVSRISGAKDWLTQWSLTAQRVEAIGLQARQDGHSVSAASAFLRSATYWACALDGVDATGDESLLRPTFRAHRRCFEAFIECSGERFVRVDVPYENIELPGYLFRPDHSGAARATLVITNGSDGALSDMWGTAAAALERDWNAFVYDGPGQQSMLFEHNRTFRPDWEAVLTPVVDTLVARTDVDARRLAGYGVSQAGYWLPRALAFEHRLGAAVVDPGVVDVSTSWTTSLGTSMVKMLDSGDRDGFNRYMGFATRMPSLRRTLAFRGRPYEHDDWFDLFSTVRGYCLDANTAEAIRTPLLITSPDGEQFWPGQSDQLAGLVNGRADVVRFLATEGADSHCQPTARLLTEQRMFDWLDSVVPG